MTADITYIGFTFRDAPLGLRERLQIRPEHCVAALTELGTFAEGRLVLTTCDRVEFYLSQLRQGVHEVLDWLARHSHVSQAAILAGATTHYGRPVARQLMTVAAGLDSRIPGESHVLGQVRDAHRRASDAGALDPILSALCRSAIHAGKRVRHETRINQTCRSIATEAVGWLGHDMDSLSRKSALILGSGNIASDVASALRARGAERLMVVSRNRQRASGLARSYGAKAAGLDALPQLIRLADIAIACTSSTSYLLGPEHTHGRTAPLHIVDLGMPRNVDPRAGEVGAVRLTHMSELPMAQPRHAPALAQSWDIVDNELRRFEAWCREREAAERVVAIVRAFGKQYDTQSRETKRRLHQHIVRIKREVAA